ncbi:hypothetical protein DPMN_094772 [Dreissena polymorpha]|uniref:Uncharacterized protein n=1 Tax=Dreissena polymorpha TaxID=45954 RepID=A0A9D4R289_DREPO|nr:hypothetical protein DPMN_094772 [Dreissena polymorpha]
MLYRVYIRQSSISNSSGSHDSIINSVRVEQCDSEPCIVHKGQDYTVHVNFTASMCDVENMEQ